MLNYQPRFVKRVAVQQGYEALLEQGKRADVRDSCVYIHIPFCRLRCTYCGFYKQLFEEALLERYVQALLLELDNIQKSGLARHKKIKAVFFGGGTPSVLHREQIAKLLAKLKDTFDLAEDCELTFESSVFDMDDAKLEACLEGGINRFSFGVQTFDTALRHSFGRPDPQEKLVKELKRYVSSGAKIIIDLIYGLPDQSLEQLLRDIELVKEIGISGLDLYKLQILDRSPLAKQLQEGQRTLITDQQLLEQYFVEAVQSLEQKGARALSCCHWTFRDEEKSLYNTYVKQGMDNIAVGAACGGRSDLWKYMKSRDIATYCDKLEQGEAPYMVFTHYRPEARLLNALFGQVDQGVLDFAALQQVQTAPLEEALLPILQQWMDRGLLKPVEITDREGAQRKLYQATTRGAFYYRQLSRELLIAAETLLYGPVTEAEQAMMTAGMSRMQFR